MKKPYLLSIWCIRKRDNTHRTPWVRCYNYKPISLPYFTANHQGKILTQVSLISKLRPLSWQHVFPNSVPFWTELYILFPCGAIPSMLHHQPSLTKPISHLADMEEPLSLPSGDSLASSLSPVPSFIFHHCPVTKAGEDRRVCVAAMFLPLLPQDDALSIILTSQSIYRGCGNEKIAGHYAFPSLPDQ